MGITERKEREKAERRRAILVCAKELILKQGAAQVRMEEIARKAELSKATVYLYFQSKEQLLKEICEESARIFLECLRTHLKTGHTGVDTLRNFWRGCLELFGNFDELITAFKVRKYLDYDEHVFLLKEQSPSQYADAAIKALKDVIDQCKAEGVFDPNLDSAVATSMLLSIFSASVGKAASIPPQERNPAALIGEMTKEFRVIIHGFAKEGVDRACLDFTR